MLKQFNVYSPQNDWLGWIRKEEGTEVHNGAGAATTEASKDAVVSEVMWKRW